MIAWYWLLIAILVTNAITAFTYEFFEWDNIWTDLLAWLALVVLYVPLSIYHICFKNTVHPISSTRMEELKKLWSADKRVKIYELPCGFYFCTDWNASKLWNKVFFIRIK